MKLSWVEFHVQVSSKVQGTEMVSLDLGEERLTWHMNFVGGSSNYTNPPRRKGRVLREKETFVYQTVRKEDN